MDDYLVKRILFKLWHSVEKGQFDSRSFVGDTALELRTAIFSTDEDLFFKEYDLWKQTCFNPKPIPETKINNCWIFNYEHQAWWRPHQSGYTQKLIEAGVYDCEEAKVICDDANQLGKVNVISVRII